MDKDAKIRILEANVKARDEIIKQMAEQFSERDLCPRDCHLVGISCDEGHEYQCRNREYIEECWEEWWK